MGRNTYTVRVGDLEGEVVNGPYKHPGPDEPEPGMRIVHDQRHWRVTMRPFDAYRTTPDANLLVVEALD